MINDSFMLQFVSCWLLTIDVSHVTQLKKREHNITYVNRELFPIKLNCDCNQMIKQ